MFSVLIAHYNNASYFKQCYESLKNQTFKDFEIIVVDDCSTDDSFEKIKNYTEQDSRIKFFKNPENKGVGFTKKRCIEEASGEICGFVDPDDAITENAIELSVKAYENNNIIATYSEINMCDNALNAVRKFNSTEKIKNGNPLFFNVNFEVAHFFTFKRKTYLETEGINPELTSAVDQDLYLKLYEKGNFYFLKNVLYLYRVHDKGVSQEKSKKIKLNENWHHVLLQTCKRRNILSIHGKEIQEIENLPKFILEKKQSVFHKILKKLKLKF